VTELCVEVTRRGRGITVRLTGELDASTVDLAAAELSRLEGERADVLLVDLSELRFMDSTGARLLVEADSRARGRGRSLVVAAGSGGPRRVIDLLGLAERLAVVDDASEAADAATA
jgi:anti-sigma B factor antagonist